MPAHRPTRALSAAVAAASLAALAFGAFLLRRRKR